MFQKKGKFFTVKKIIALVLAGIILVGGICLYFQKKNYVPEYPAEVIAKGDIESIISVSGIVESEKSRVYYAPLNAKVAHVFVELGDMVHTGDELLTYDTEDLEFAQKERKLESEASENSYKSAIAESDKQQRILDESEQTLANLEIIIQSQRDFINNLKDYITDEKAKKKLDLLAEKYKLERQQNGIAVNMEIKPDGKITDSMWSAEYEVKNKLDEVNKKIEEIDLNRDFTEVEKQIVKEQEKLADLEEYKAEMKADKSSAKNSILNEYKKKELQASNEKTKVSEESAQAHLNEAMAGISAEFNGIITEINVHDGFVTDQSSKLMVVESSDDVRVNVSLSKYDLEKVALGQKAEVTIAGKKYQGTVSKINHVAQKNDAGSRLVTAHIHIDNPDENIFLGIEGQVLIHAQSAKDVPLIAFAGVNTDMNGDFCYVIEDGIIQKRKITIGITSEEAMEIVDGLNAGEVVITDTSMGIEEGQAAKAILPENTQKDTAKDKMDAEKNSEQDEKQDSEKNFEQDEKQDSEKNSEQDEKQDAEKNSEQAQ